MIEQSAGVTPSMQGTTSIPLTQGKHSLVDGEHAHLVIGQKWYCNHGYAVRRVGSIKVCMHNQIWQAINGPIPTGKEVDHINGDKLDNRIENLRLVTHRENGQNSKERREGKTTSKYPGVSWNKPMKKWQAQIQVNSRNIHIGYFDSEEEAAMAYQSTVDDLSEHES